ncbi:hypothetical protein ACWCOT_02785 [Nonomuraea bangladeshensis]
MEAPDGLDATGLTLWQLVTAEHELTARERLILAEACYTADELATLRKVSVDADAVVVGSTGQPKVHPLFAELRQHRQAYVKLIDALAFPAEDEEAGLSPAAQRAKNAAEARWMNYRQKWGPRGAA